MLRISEVPLISSLHGELRRTQRDLSKRDLKSAVLFGVKEQGFPHPITGELRWKYTFADIVYITDVTSTKEVTSWALELPLSPISMTDRVITQHEEAKRRLLDDSSIITSHHICIVDMSASMRQSDMNGHKSRCRAVYYSLVEDYVDKAVSCAGTFTGTDVVSVIEMRDDATVVLELEPVSGVLYNKFVELAKGEKYARSHGNYVPSLQKAFELLRKYDNIRCTPSIFFLSDGRPSDISTRYKGLSYPQTCFNEELKELISNNCDHFRNRLTFIAVGYGHIEFEVMKTIVDVARSSHIKEAKFLQTSIDSNAMTDAMSSIISSTTETRTLLSRLNCFSIKDSVRIPSKALKDVQVITEKAAVNIPQFLPDEWRKFTNPVGQGVLGEGSTDVTDHNTQHCERFTLEWVQRPDGRGFIAKYKKIRFLDDRAVGILVKKKYFGEGAERLVFEMTEIDAKGVAVGLPMVAKESKWEMKEGVAASENFQYNFLKTQLAAGKLAKKFNDKLDKLKVDVSIPRIFFLECFVYGGDGQYFLVEKRLNQANYRKWNDNAGGVDGISRANLHFIPLTHNVGVLEEGDEDEVDEDEEDELAHEKVDDKELSPLVDARILDLQKRVLDIDVPQCFSHFTHVFTQREKLVCDLQGELVGGIRFECTDPCIHHRKSDMHHHRRSSNRSRDATDKGLNGINDFFRTHQCNALCKILGLNK